MTDSSFLKSGEDAWAYAREQAQELRLARWIEIERGRAHASGRGRPRRRREGFPCTRRARSPIVPTQCPIGQRTKSALDARRASRSVIAYSSTFTRVSAGALKSGWPCASSIATSDRAARARSRARSARVARVHADDDLFCARDRLHHRRAARDTARLGRAHERLPEVAVELILLQRLRPHDDVNVGRRGEDIGPRRLRLVLLRCLRLAASRP